MVYEDLIDAGKKWEESHDDRRVALPLQTCERCGNQFYMPSTICASCQAKDPPKERT